MKKEHKISKSVGLLLISAFSVLSFVFITITSQGGNPNSFLAFAISINGYVPPEISVSCSVDQTSTTEGGSANWSSTVSGGDGTYRYLWVGDDNVTGTSSSVSHIYSTAGTFSAILTVWSGTQSITKPCNASLTVTAPDPITNTTTTSRRGGSRAGGRVSGGSVLGAFTGDNTGGSVLGAFTDSANANQQCSAFINSYMKIGINNDKFDVAKLQAYLISKGYSLQLNAIFDRETENAVKQLQLDHKAEILDPWTKYGFSSTPSGYVYKTTRYFINNQLCSNSEIYPTLGQ